MGHKTFLSTLTLPLLVTCTLSPASAAPMTTQQISVLEATCTQVMLLEKTQAEFSGCVSSLSDSLTQEMQQARAVLSYRDCNRSGLKRGTPDFSRCVLDQEDANASAEVPIASLDAAIVKPSDDSLKGYFSTSFALRHRREQFSCAQIGLEPDSGAFASCVNNLDENLWNVEYPPG
jgi:hypothetical protein